ncbi:DUF3592 domain-containing protein [Streptomyces sp. NPDC015346]|uniref:DUF3592 domain-containing protein n=1 Tax=Streptomyces sp. NPDC015346 TaxID=3364954 RepID=UPI0036FA826C
MGEVIDMRVIVGCEVPLVKGEWGFRSGPVVPYGPPVNLVTAVLVCFIIASVPVFIFGLMLIAGERDELKKMTELNESGIEVQARLVSLTPINTQGTGRVIYEFETPDGQNARHQTGVSMGPAHVVGDLYPLVYDPRNTKRVHMGTKATVRKERRFRQGSVRGAKRLALLSFVAGVMATVGLIVSPS